MEAVGTAFLVVFVPVLLVVSLIGMVRHKRRAKLRAAARARRFKVNERADQFANMFTIAPFGRGRHREVKDAIAGSIDGLDFLTMAYWYEEKSYGADGGSNATTYRRQVTAIKTPRGLRPLAFTADSGLQRVLERWGLGEVDVDVESHAFNQRWRVACHDEGYARRALSPSVIAALVDAPESVQHVIAEDGRLAVVHDSPATDLEWLDETVRWLHTVPGGIPRFVLDDSQP